MTTSTVDLLEVATVPAYRELLSADHELAEVAR